MQRTHSIGQKGTTRNRAQGQRIWKRHWKAEQDIYKQRVQDNATPIRHVEEKELAPLTLSSSYSAPSFWLLLAVRTDELTLKRFQSVWFTDFSLVCTGQSSAFAKALVHRFRIEFRCQATRTDNRQRPVTEGRPKLLQPPDFSSLLKLQSGL